jgi:hypothetical protein
VSRCVVTLRVPGAKVRDREALSPTRGARALPGSKPRPSPSITAKFPHHCRTIVADLEAALSLAVLQVRRVKGVALAEIAGLVTAAEPANALFGSAVRK